MKAKIKNGTKKPNPMKKKLVFVRNLLAVAVETDYSFKEAESIKEFIADPSKFVVAAPVAAAASATTEAAPAAKEEAPAAKESDDESGSDDDMGFGLFD
jgi:large subunit ribosomal protein LP0